jgi:DedD protein
MSMLSFFNKKRPEATSVAEALSGTMNNPAAKPKRRKSESRQSDSDELLVPEKKRARRRLIGAIVMVLAVVIGLPMVLDTEPKPSGKNIIIQIPSKELPAVSTERNEKVAEEDTPARDRARVPDENKVENKLSPPISVAETASSTASSAPAKPATTTAAATKPPVKTETKPAQGLANAASVKDDKSVGSKEPESKAADSSTVEHSPNRDESTRALAILNGSAAASGSSATEAAKSPAKENTRIVVQIGAFTTQEKVDELRDKLTSAGIKSYIQKVATSTGEKIRVRVGPFSDKESADKAKKQLEKLGLNGSLITL